jgi:RHS repeat-associated protein
LGYTGEWQDGDVGLVYLRARWYAPGVGRFTQPDPWEGDRWQPVSLQVYLYASDNPVNQTDPSGLYGKDEVHYQKTLEIAQTVLGHLGIYGARTALLVARGDRCMDEMPLAVYQHLHFVDWPVAHANAERAIQMKHPYVFGAALHQVQDYFSHYYEGFRFPGEGHLRYTIGRRPPWTIAEFFRKHPRSWVESQLSVLYPGIDFSGEDRVEDGAPPFTDNELIDLYLREWRAGLSKWEERERYGYNTDRYFSHTYRDRQVEWETGHFIRRFEAAILCDPCRWYAMMSRGENESDVRAFFSLPKWP